MQISLIVAIDNNNAIGKDNAMPWHLPEDLKYFKNITSGFPIIMGKNTFLSLNQKPLPNRLNIVISQSLKPANSPSLIIVNSLNHAIETAAQANNQQCFIIGGGQIYAQALSLATTLYISKINTSITGGAVFFPKINFTEWELVYDHFFQKNEKNLFDINFCKYHRKVTDKK